ncbi:MAG: hypothetical protein A3E75_05335 [Planctomycetes bacterium RIFCSPHIGHO2_12_FULL_51_37]|nr:MAG: hypothetical protein A3E75_05335 [Planctomycetes bacterium RIFCSPHIGHO2_12_FULL_51_37]
MKGVSTLHALRGGKISILPQTPAAYDAVVPVEKDHISCVRQDSGLVNVPLGAAAEAQPRPRFSRIDCNNHFILLSSL